MQVKGFKKINKLAVCAEDPLEKLIPIEIRYETMLKIKQESIDLMGQDYTGDCKKRLTCFGKDCLGRTLPWKSPTAKSYLEQLAKTQNIKNNELFITTNCGVCPISSKCTSLCNQINDYIERDRIIEVEPVYQRLTENIPFEKKTEILEPLLPSTEEIPWDCLSEVKTKIVRMRIYEQKDFNHIAKLLNLNNQANSKYLFYSAVTKLSKYAIMRKFLNENKNKLTEGQISILNEVYVNNKTIKQTALRLNKSKQAVQQQIASIIKKFNLKYNRFVYKKNGKMIYNVSEILK